MAKYDNKKSFDEIKAERKSQPGISLISTNNIGNGEKTSGGSGKKFNNTKSFADIKASRSENAFEIKQSKLINDYNNYVSEIGKRGKAYNGGYVKNSSDDYIYSKTKKADAQNDIDRLRTEYLVNPTTFSRNRAKELSALDSIEKNYGETADNFKSLNEFYSQFEDENQFDYWNKTYNRYKDEDLTDKSVIDKLISESDDEEVKEWLKYNYDNSLSPDEILSLKRNAKDNTENLYYTDLYNTKYRKNIIDTLQNTVMNGEETSVYDALSELKTLRTEYDRIMRDAAENWQADNQSEEGKERNAARVRRTNEINDRISAVKKTVEDLGIDYNDAELYVNGKGNDSVSNSLDWLGTAATKGIATFNRGWSATLDLILGNPLKYFGWEDNPISSTANYYKDSLDNYTYDLAKKTEKLGGTDNKALEVSGELISGTVSALPDMIMALMSGGTSTAASAASLSTKAAYETSNILGKAGITVQTMMNNPLYWTSFMREYGTDYEEAKAEGADDLAALFSSTISSFLNAGIEIGFDGASGIQGLPSELLNADKSAVRAWVESALDEGKEEVLQDIVNKLAAKAFYDHDRPMMSFGTGEGVLDPESISENFGMGFGVGAILGGGPAILNSVLGGNSNVSQYDTLLENQGRRFSYMGNEILDFALQNTDLQYTSQALSQISDVNNMSYRDLGLLYLAEMVDTQVRFADSQTSEQIDAVADSFTADGGMAKYINESRNIYKQKLESNVNDYYSKQYNQYDNISLPFETDQSSPENVSTINTTQSSYSGKNSMFNNGSNVDNTSMGVYNISEGVNNLPKTEFKYKASLNAISDKTGENIVIKSYKGSDGSGIVFETSAGDMNINDIHMNPNMKYAINFAVNSYNKVAVNSFLRHMDDKGSSGKRYLHYAKGYNTFYQYGLSGNKKMTFEKAAELSPGFVDFIGTDAAKAAFNIGRAQAEAENKKAEPRKEVSKKAEGKYINKTDDTSLDEFYSKAAEKLHIDIERLESLGDRVNGQFVSKILTIGLSEESNNEWITFLHENLEVFDEFAPEETSEIYDSFVDYALYNAKTEAERDRILRTIQKYQDEYRRVEGEKTYREALKEYVNDHISDIFDDVTGASEYIAWLNSDSGYTKEKANKILNKLCEYIEKIVEKIMEFVNKLNLSDSKRVKIELGTEQANKIKDLFFKAGDAAVENIKKAEVKETASAEVKHQIAYTEDNIPVVVVEENILENVPRSDWIKTVKNVMSENFSEGIPVSGRLVKVNAITKNEYLNSKYTQQQKRTTRTIYKDKLKSANNLDEIVLASTNYVNEDIKHERKDSFKEFARGNVLIDIGGNRYNAKVIIGFTNSNSMILYDIVDFEKASFNIKERGFVKDYAESRKSMTIESSNEDSISQKSDSVNSQYTQNSEKDTQQQIDIDSDEMMNYNNEKGVDGSEREDNRGYGSKRYEILQSRRVGRGNTESNRKNKGRYARNRTEQGKTRLTYDTGNNVFGYEFETVPGSKMSERSRRASELFTKAGIESYVFNPESAIFMSKNGEGEKRNCNAVTVCGGQVIIISNNLEENISGSSLFAHEAIHSYLKSESRVLRKRAEVLHDTILENINPLSEYYSSILNIISFSSYSKLPDIKIAEEVVAFIAADIASDVSYISEENFQNPDEVLKAWNRMFAEYGLPENNTDRRYQLDISDYTDPDEVKSVIRQNEKYKKLTEYLRTEVKRTYGKIVKPNYTKFVAATLKEEYNCSLPKEEIVEMLDGFYGYLSKEKKQSDYYLSKTYAEEIARNILESSSDKKEISDFSKAVLADIRKLNVTLNEEQKNEVAYTYGTYGEYRRKNFGRFTVGNNGVNIEAAWDELSEKYPSVFESDANPAEMPLKLVEITDMLNDGYDSGDGLTYEDAVEALSSELIQRYIEAPRRETFADKKYNEYKDSLKKVREELKADYKERLAGVKQTAKEKTSEMLLRQKAKYEGQISRAKARKVKSEYRDKIKKTVNRLTKRLTHPTEGKYVPKNLVKATAEILSGINLDTGRGGKASEKISQLKTVYDSLKNDPVYNVVYDDVISDMIQTLSQNVGTVSVSNMSETNLRQTYEVLKSLEHIISNAVKVRGIETEKNVFEFAKELINETSMVNKSILTDSPIASWLNVQSRSQVMFERLAGYKKDSYWLKLYEMLNKAQMKETQIQMEGSQLFAELLSDEKQLKTLTDVKNTVDIGLKDENGNTVEITRGMMLSIRDSLRNEDNIRHITYGGYIVPVLKDYYKGNTKKAFGTGAVKVGGALNNINVHELIKTIDENLTEYELKWLEAGRKFFDSFSKNKINEATNEMYGFEKARVTNYFPIHTNSDYLQANFESITKDMSLENSGFIKDRVKASSPLILEDYTSVINSQLNKVAKYAALTPAVKTFNKIYGKTESGYTNSVQAAINSKFGNGGKKYIENLLSDIVGSRKDEITFFDKLRGNMAQATLSLNPRVALAQAASYPTAASEIGWKPLLKALARKDSDSIYGISRADRELIAKYSPLLWYRSLGNSNVELGDIKEMSKTQNVVMRKMRFLMGWINAMDSATVGRLWYAAQYYVEDNFRELTPKSEVFYEKTAEVFNNIVEKTQPNYTTMQRPDILRNPNAAVRYLTMFLTQRLQNMNILYDAMARYKKYKSDFKGGRNGVTEGDVKTAGKKLRNAVSSQVAAAVTITVMKALCDMLLQSMYNYRDKDKEVTAESMTMGMLDSFFESVISNFLCGSELYSLLSSMITKEKYYGISMNGINTFAEVLENLVTMSNDLSFDNFVSLGNSIATVLGIPSKNAIKIGKGMYYWYTDITNGNAFSFEASGGTASMKSKLEKALNYSSESKDFKLQIDKILEDKEIELYEKKIKEGYKEDYAKEYAKKNCKSSVKSSMTSLFKEEYVSASAKRQAEIRKYMYKSGLYGSVDDVIELCNKWVTAYKEDQKKKK